jgi:putative membrane protein
MVDLLQPNIIELLIYALIGTGIAAILGIIPALHIYNVAGMILIFYDALLPYLNLTPERMAFLFIGMTTGYTMVNIIPSIFLSAPDESTIFTVLPGQKYLLQQRGFEAVVLSGIGSLGGLMFLLLLTPVASRLIPMLRNILQPHLGWILWTSIAYMLLSEWPKGTERASTGLGRWWEGWQSLLAGLGTFLLSGILGFVLMYRLLVPPAVAYQNMMPAFVGLFAVPWVIQNLLARTRLPQQHIAKSIDAPHHIILQGTLAGSLGGLFAAFFPVITAGIGGFLAGHATAQRDDRAFLISQGAAKLVYYVGGLLFFFVPGLHITRGGMAWMISTHYSAYTPTQYYWAVAAVLLSGVTAFLLSLGLAQGIITLVTRIGYRSISWGTLIILISIVTTTTGLGGLAICLVATGIGLLPVLWGSRRMNAMGVLLLPIALNIIGVGDIIASFLGLL